MFKHFSSTASVQRLVKSGDKTSYHDIGVSIKGHLKPLGDEKQNVGFERLANTYSFTTIFGSNLMETDKLIINGEKYSVRGINNHGGLKISFMRAIIVKDKV